MSVYVDRLQAWGSKSWCHMIADTLEELHAMIDAIGGKRAWFQEPPKASFPHYDVQRRLRGLAVKRGAIELDRAGFVTKVRELRPKFGVYGNGNPAPDEARPISSEGGER